MRTSRKVYILILSALMILSMMPFSVFADAQTNSSTDGAPNTAVAEENQSKPDDEKSSDSPDVDQKSETDESAKTESADDKEKVTEKEEADKAKPSDDDKKQDANEKSSTSDGKKSNTSKEGTVPFKGKAGGVEVSVEAPKNAFPEGTTMKVVKADDDDVLAAINDTLEGEAKTVKAVDITFRNADGKEIQPTDPIQVTLKSKAVAEAESPVVVHVDKNKKGEYVGEKVEEVKTDTDKKEVSFEAEHFSVYAIVDDGETSVGGYRATYKFVNDDETPYYFLNNAGEEVDNQIIKNNEFLEDVGLPDISSNQTFLGWYVSAVQDKDGNDIEIDDVKVGDEIVFDEGNAIPVTTNYDYTVTVKAKYQTIYYATFYEESAGGIVLTRKQVATDENGQAIIDISKQTVAAPTSTLAFTGWSREPGTNDDDRNPITGDDTVIDLAETGDINLYPVFKSAHWITFVTARSGSGASYIAPAYVLNGETAASVEPADPTWTGYEFQGWYVADSWEAAQTGGTEFDFSQELDSDVTVYARWKDATAKYKVVYWRQQVTDAVGTADADKKYDYVGSEERTSVKGTVVSPTDEDKTPSEKTVGSDVDTAGFSFNEANTTTSVEVQADGTSVLNVYFDRNEYTLAFTVSGGYYRDYVIATDDNGTQYAYVDGEYVQLTRVTKTETEYYLARQRGNGGYEEYTGTVYSDRYYTEATKPYDTNTQYYGRRNGGWINLYWRTRTNTTYEWQLNGEPYNGTRYKYQNTQSHIVRHITALYGQSVKDNFPITNENDGTSYDGYTWSDTGNPQTYSYVLETIETMPAADVTFTGSERGTQKTIYYYVEVVNGEDTSGLTTKSFNGKTYKLYKTVQHNFHYLTYDEEYHPITGFERNRAWAEPYFGQTRYSDYIYYNYDWHEIGYFYDNGDSSDYYPEYSGYTVASSDAGSDENQAPISRATLSNNLYYNRNSYNLEFIDSLTNNNLGTESVQYEESLEGYEPEATPKASLPGYQFKGWYKDPACTEPFDFTETMPANNVPVYAGWEEIWYKIEVDPNGGQLSEGESTFFWETYGDTVEQYGDITRDYVEDENGDFYYLYHPYSRMDEDNVDADNYYRKWDRIATYSSSNLVNNYSNYNPETGQYETVTQVPDTITEDLTTKYKYEKNAYALIGWYKVNEDGSLGDPYNFAEEVTSDLKIRAMWRRVGEYRVNYDIAAVDESGNPLTDSEGNPVNAVTTPNDGNTYADQSDAAFLGKAEAPAGYVFVGWYYDGAIHEPGDVFVVDANKADENKTLHVKPVLRKIENIPVRVTHINWYANTIDTSGDAISSELVVSGGEETKQDGNGTYIANEDLHLNDPIDIKSASTYQYEGYKFLGWAKSKNAGRSDLFLKYENGKYYAKDSGGNWEETTKVAADEDLPYDDLYAIWEKAPDLLITKAIGNRDYADLTQQFSIQVALKDSANNAVSGTYEYVILDAEGEKISGPSDAVFDGLGKANLSIKDGQTIKLLDLPNGTVYTVEEKNVPSNYTVTYIGNGQTGTLDDDKYVVVVNTMKQIIITGIDGRSSAIIVVILAALAGVGLFALKRAKRHRES